LKLSIWLSVAAVAVKVGVTELPVVAVVVLVVTGAASLAKRQAAALLPNQNLVFQVLQQ
jgi:Sec-independent protein translocase protein TatA